MDFILPISIYIYEKMFFNSQQTTFANTLIWELAIRFTYQKEEQLPLKKKITNDMSALVLCFWNFWIKSIPWKHNSRQSPLKRCQSYFGLEFPNFEDHLQINKSRPNHLPATTDVWKNIWNLFPQLSLYPWIWFTM